MENIGADWAERINDPKKESNKAVAESPTFTGVRTVGKLQMKASCTTWRVQEDQETFCCLEWMSRFLPVYGMAKCPREAHASCENHILIASVAITHQSPGRASCVLSSAGLNSMGDPCGDWNFLPARKPWLKSQSRVAVSAVPHITGWHLGEACPIPISIQYLHCRGSSWPGALSYVYVFLVSPANITLAKCWQTTLIGVISACETIHLTSSLRSILLFGYQNEN